MSQSIRIGVTADSSQGAAAISKMDKAAEGLAESVDDIAKASKGAFAEMAKLEAIVERFARLQHVGDAMTKSINASGAAAANAAKAFAHMGVPPSGWPTGAGPGNAPPPPGYRPPGMGPGPRGGYPRVPPQRPSMGSQMLHGAARGMGGMPGGSLFGAVLAGGLAGAAVETVLGTAIKFARRGLSAAANEAIGVDTLMRRSHSGRNYVAVRDQIRGAVDHLGLSYTEGVTIANRMAVATGHAGNVPGDMHTAIGFARSFGIDPGEAGNFFGNMRRMGAQGTDDQASRRLALMIGEAVAKSGYTAAGTEMMKAVANFATTARASLSAPNISEYASELTGMTKTGIPGLDPMGAASILARADASVRAGGGMGVAGLNFTNASLGLKNVFQTRALYESGLFGSTGQAFGPDSAMGRWDKINGVAPPKMTGITNLTKELDRFHATIKDPLVRLESMANFFGLNMAQTAALDMVNPADLQGVPSLLQKAGISPDKMNVTSYADLGTLSAAKNIKDLNPIYNSTLKRDISDVDKAKIKRDHDDGNFGRLQVDLAKIVATHGQQDTQGSAIRDAKKDLEDALTKLGQDLLGPLKDIDNATTYLAGVVGYKPKALDKLAGIDPKGPYANDDLWGTKGWKSLGNIGGGIVDWAKRELGIGPSGPAPSGFGGKDDLDRAANAIYQIESNSGKNYNNAPLKGHSATGPMQMIPSTFAANAKPGESLTNPADNMRAGRRLIGRLWDKYHDWNKVAYSYANGSPDAPDRNPGYVAKFDRLMAQSAAVALTPKAPIPAVPPNGSPLRPPIPAQDHMVPANISPSPGTHRSVFPPWVPVNSKGIHYSTSLLHMPAWQRENDRRSYAAIKAAMQHHDTHFFDDPLASVPPEVVKAAKAAHANMVGAVHAAIAAANLPSVKGVPVAPSVVDHNHMVVGPHGTGYTLDATQYASWMRAAAKAHGDQWLRDHHPIPDGAENYARLPTATHKVHVHVAGEVKLHDQNGHEQGAGPVTGFAQAPAAAGNPVGF